MVDISVALLAVMDLGGMLPREVLNESGISGLESAVLILCGVVAAVGLIGVGDVRRKHVYLYLAYKYFELAAIAYFSLQTISALDENWANPSIVYLYTGIRVLSDLLMIYTLWSCRALLDLSEVTALHGRSVSVLLRSLPEAELADLSRLTP